MHPLEGCSKDDLRVAVHEGVAVGPGPRHVSLPPPPSTPSTLRSLESFIGNGDGSPCSTSLRNLSRSSSDRLRRCDRQDPLRKANRSRTKLPRSECSSPSRPSEFPTHPRSEYPNQFRRSECPSQEAPMSPSRRGLRPRLRFHPSNAFDDRAGRRCARIDGVRPVDLPRAVRSHRCRPARCAWHPRSSQHQPTEQSQLASVSQPAPPRPERTGRARRTTRSRTRPPKTRGRAPAPSSRSVGIVARRTSTDPPARKATRTPRPLGSGMEGSP